MSNLFARQPALRLYLTVALLLAAILACGTAVTHTPHYVCPTALPTPFIPQPTPLPGTLLPPLTPIPLPPTPYIITPPQDFYVGDAVFVGYSGDSLRLRFRLLGIQSRPAESGARYLHTWQIEIRSIGSATYETVPIALTAIMRVETAYGAETGTWPTSEAAMREAGYLGENYDPLAPHTTRIYRLAAYGPIGSVGQIAYTLDGESGNRITWTNNANPYCSGDIAS